MHIRCTTCSHTPSPSRRSPSSPCWRTNGRLLRSSGEALIQVPGLILGGRVSERDLRHPDTLLLGDIWGLCFRDTPNCLSASTQIITPFRLMMATLGILSVLSRKQIMDSVTAVLSSEAALSTDAASDALAAACALDGLGSVAALNLLLETRSVYLAQQLEAAAAVSGDHPSKPASPADLAERRLVQLAQGVQTTIHQVGELFLPIPHQQHRAAASTSAPGTGTGSSVCMLQAVMEEEASDASELLFSGGRGTLSNGGGAEAAHSQSSSAYAASSEIEAWHRESRRCVYLQSRWLQHL